MSIYPFIIATLAVWRVTHLLSEEDGPFDLIIRLREKIGNNVLGQLMDCFYCLSIWIAIPFAFIISGNLQEGILHSLALSGAACIIQKVIKRDVG
jgi:Protein of unknown function (DUF1360)